MPRPLNLAVTAAVAAATVSMSAAAAQATVVNPFATTAAGAWGITVDSSGNLHTAINEAFGGSPSVWKVTPSGLATPIPLPTATFPVGITVDGAGNVYTANNGVGPNVSKVASDGSVTQFTAGGVSGWGITSDGAGNIFVANSGAGFYVGTGTTVGKATSSGVTSTFATTGTRPTGITVDSAGNVYTANNAVDTVTKITPAGAASTLGSTGAGPDGITVDWAGNVYTANVTGDSVTKITPAGSASTLATGINGPWGIAIDSAGNLYTADNDGGSVSQIAPDGTVTALVSGLATGQQNGPRGVAIDASGNLFATTAASGDIVRITSGGGTPPIAPAPPATPPAPTATAGVGSATVSVTNPVDARYGAPSSYAVAAASDATKTCTITAPATSCTITGLTAGTAYAFTATATLNAWVTPASVASNAVTPTAAPAATPQSVGLIAKVLAPRKRLVSGQRAVLAIRATNAGTRSSSGTTMCIRVPSNLVITRAPGATRTSRKACFSAGVLATGGSVTKAIVVRAVSTRSVRRTVTGTVTATGLTVDPAAPATLTIRPRAPRPVVTG